MSKHLLMPALIVSLLFLVSAESVEVRAQDATVSGALGQIEDDDIPIAHRAQLAMQLLLEKSEEGLDGLRRILLAEKTKENTRMAIVTGVLNSPDFPLLSDLLGLYGSATGTELAGSIEEQFRVARSHKLAKRLLPLGTAEDQEPERRSLVIRLLGVIALKEVVEPLIGLWGTGKPASVAEAARSALYQVIPEKFASPASALEFWQKNRHKDLQRIATEAAVRAQDGQSSGGIAKDYIKSLKRLLPSAPLEHILGLYLQSALWEAREMGVRRLATYPYEQREKPDPDVAKRRAAKATLDLLEKEADPGVAKQILTTIETLVESAKQEDADRTLELLARRVKDPDRSVAMAALSALGALRDARASSRHLCDLYDGLDPEETEFRLAILAAIEASGNGVADWVLAKVRRRDPEEEVMIRLLRILQNQKGVQKKPDCVPTIEGLFVEGEAGPKLREEAASTLGRFLGNGSSDARVVGALARHGLEDADPVVRLVSATMLRRGNDVNDEVIEILRKHLGKEEVDLLVRGAAARSLLVLRRVSAVEFLKEHLGDDTLWQEARNFLKADILAKGRSAEALSFVITIAGADAPGRCAEAAAMVLGAADLSWEGEVGEGRLEIGFLLARSLDMVGKSKEALEVLDKTVTAERNTDPGNVETLLLRARILRRTGEAARVAETLKPILELPEPPAGAFAKATLEQARAHIELGQVEEALKAVTPLVGDPDFGEAAQAVVEEAEKRRNGGTTVPDAPETGVDALFEALDGDDADARTKATEALKALGEEAHPALLSWIGKKKPAEVPAALKVIEAVTGVTVPYDPEAPEEAREKALEALREKLAG